MLHSGKADVNYSFDNHKSDEFKWNSKHTTQMSLVLLEIFGQFFTFFKV